MWHFVNYTVKDFFQGLSHNNEDKDTDASMEQNREKVGKGESCGCVYRRVYLTGGNSAPLPNLHCPLNNQERNCPTMRRNESRSVSCSACILVEIVVHNERRSNSLNS